MGQDRMAVAPPVQGVHTVMYVGGSLNLNRLGHMVGTYGTTIGCTSHDVYDVPLESLHPFVRDRIPAKIASNQEGTILRLYVPRSQRGQITDIGILNGVYASPGAPYVPRNGQIYTAPGDAEKYRRVAPAREPVQNTGAGYRDAADSWHPGPGNRFKVTEIS